jgi:hypothetical protein
MEDARRVSVAKLKANFAKKFPDHPLTRILLSEPDILAREEFLAKAQTWLAFFHGVKENE